MGSILAAAITGMLTLLGVLVSNSRSRAVMEVKFEDSPPRSRSTTTSWSAPTSSKRTWL